LRSRRGKGESQVWISTRSPRLENLDRATGGHSPGY
jgi:hypothetical protein